MEKNQIFRKEILKWYRNGGSRDFFWRDPETEIYSLIICEILLQRTRAENVEDIAQEFLDRFPDPGSLSRAKTDEIKKIIKPLGLYRQRTKKIKELAWHLENGIPKDEDGLKELPGIGEYIASALMSFGFKEPSTVIDVNSSRVISRVFGIKSKGELRRESKVIKKAEELLPEKRHREFNFALLDFGARVCTSRNPECGNCPLASICSYFNSKFKEESLKE